MGRRLKLTPEIQTKLSSAIAAGNYHEVACDLVGVGTTTFYNWMKKGEKSSSGKFREFWESIKKAEAVAEAKRIKLITDAAEQNWQAAAWYLERRYPNKWGRQTRVEKQISNNTDDSIKNYKNALNEIAEEVWEDD